MPSPIIVSYSELDTFRQCPLKHQLAYKQRWTKEKSPDSALGRGTLFHEIMEAHHGVLRAHQDDREWKINPNVHEAAVLAESARAVMPLLYDDKTGEQTNAQELLEWLYTGYVEHYGADREWKILGIEIPFQVQLPKPDGKPSHYWYKGKIDRLIQSRTDGTIWIEDHKTGADAPNDFELQIDDQFGGYIWAVRQLGYDVAGSIHSFARTKRLVADYPGYDGKSKPSSLDQRFRRYYMNRSQRELDALAADLYAAARNAYPPKSAQLPLYSAPDVRQCGWKCDFKEVHLMMRQGIRPESALKGEGFHQDFTRH